MSGPDWSSELDFAVRIARRAGAIAQRHAATGFEVQIKADRTPVTAADLEIEAMIRAAIGAEFPGDAVLGEEAGLEGDGERCWIIDPIDGTKNYAAGIPIWGTLVALAVAGRPVVGVAHAPALGELYAAAAGAGATLNGNPVHVSEVDTIEQAMLLDSGLGELLRSPWGDPYLKLVARCRRSRGFGDLWGHLLVARGAAEMVLEPSLRRWDVAALEVIVTEAGGCVSAIDGGPVLDAGSVLTSNARLHGELVSALRASA